MIRWKIYKRLNKDEYDNMHMVRVRRRLDAVVAKRFLDSWNIEENQKQKMFVPQVGFVDKEEYFQQLEFGE